MAEPVKSGRAANLTAAAKAHVAARQKSEAAATEAAEKKRNEAAAAARKKADSASRQKAREQAVQKVKARPVSSFDKGAAASVRTASPAVSASPAASAPAAAAAAEPAKPAVVDPIPGWRDKITSNFGMRMHPVYHVPKMHTGVDFGFPGGTPIQSAKDGKVVFAGDGGGFGNLVVVQHADSTYTMYAHCQSMNVKQGQEVKAGDVVGKVGTTGTSTGDHLHFEVRQGGSSWQNAKPVDPVAFLNGGVPMPAADVGPGESYASTGGGGGGGGSSGSGSAGGAGSSGGSAGSSGGGSAPSTSAPSQGSTSPSAPSQGNSGSGASATRASPSSKQVVDYGLKYGGEYGYDPRSLAKILEKMFGEPWVKEVLPRDATFRKFVQEKAGKSVDELSDDELNALSAEFITMGLAAGEIPVPDGMELTEAPEGVAGPTPADEETPPGDAVDAAPRDEKVAASLDVAKVLKASIKA